MAKEVNFQDVLQSSDDDIKKYKQRDLSQTLFFKVACRTFGPPKSRTRRIIAPPMQKVESDPLNLTGKPMEASRVGAKPGDEKILRTKVDGQILGTKVDEKILGTKVDGQILGTKVDEKILRTKVDGQILGTKVDEKILGTKVDGQILGTKVDEKILGTKVDGQILGTKVDEKILGTKVDGQILGTKVDEKILGTKVDGKILGNKVGGQILGTKVDGQILGTKVDGQILGTKVDGQILGTKVDEKILGHKVDGQILGNKVDGQILRHKLDGQILGTKMDGQILRHKLDGQILGTKVDGQILRHKLDGQILGTKVDGQILGTKVDGQILGTKVDGQILGTKVDEKILGHKLDGQILGTKVDGQILGHKVDGQILGNKVGGQILGHKVDGQILGTKVDGQILGTNVDGQILGTKVHGQILGTNVDGQILRHKRDGHILGTKMDEQNISNWILERKNLRAQLDSMGDLEKWLQGKPNLTALETRVQDKMAERRLQSRMSQQTNRDTASCEAERSVPRRSSQRSAVTPSIQQPAPEALAILDSYLHQRRLRLVDLYNQTDKRKRKEISSKDLKSVRKEADIPISDLQLDDLVISLGNKHPNCMNYKELCAGRNLWWKKNLGGRRKGVSVSLGAGAPVKCLRPSSDQKNDSGGTRPSSALSVSLLSVGDTKTRSPPGRSAHSEGSDSRFLQVPPVSLDEMRPLSYEDMEEIGKNYRERKRRAKSNTRLLDWLDQCRLVRTGNAAVDAHSLPSTLGEESAELVEQFRRRGLQQYHKILRLCQAYDVPLTEELLEEALLYPGDKLICESGDQLPLRQPGVGLSSKDRFTRKSSATKKPKGRHNVEKDPESSPRHCNGPYPPNTYVAWVKTKVRGKKKAGTETLRCWTTFEQFQEMSGNLKRKFPHRFYTSDDNAFWPGQLVEKLRFYLPQAAESDPHRPPRKSQATHPG
ncbi:EF-hand calcium-binding domain-containing protein 12 isoform X3 [Rana temporaria]|uniref:EF-hand calcium-binding domain-containing protein 12 isoform X3 n=1 Tax=Rana temporaria TaxID=8407 RepID=UPI001AACC598|nr:EF-hand calcium-binding domain-containing protein 12 isoform X3 [Rana temporaria]